SKPCALSSTEKKLLPKWSIPRRVVARNVNSYTLVTLDNTILAGSYSTRRLRRFWPRGGTKLAVEQAEVEEREATLVNPKQLEDAMQVEEERTKAKLTESDNDDWEDVSDDE
ncbi:hypothetical protein C0991_006713, partial [Blastosporella zonata]